MKSAILTPRAVRALRQKTRIRRRDTPRHGVCLRASLLGAGAGCFKLRLSLESQAETYVGFDA